MKKLLSCMIALVFLLLADLPGMAGNPLRIKTVVIDAGHGGHDSGCVSPDGKTTEKFLTLDIARRFGAAIRETYPDVKVILTRDEDKYVTLSGRADIANNAGADLFVSIHINATANGPSANGFSIHCLGQSSQEGNDLFSKNLELCQRENSVIKLEEDYQTRYQGFDPSDPQSYIFFSLLQNANLSLSLAFADDVNTAMKRGPIRRSRGVSQDPFWVLWRTTMPSVLVECAFISNPEDLASLRKPEDRAGIARCLLNAFTAYKTRYEAGGEGKPEPRQEEESPAVTTVRYGTQVVATSKVLGADDPFFKGYVPTPVRSGNLIRYIIGVSVDPEEAKKNNAEITKKFTDSFLVRIDGNTVTRIP